MELLIVWKKIKIIALGIVFALQLPAYTSDEIKRAGYDILYQNQCMREEGMPDCDPDHMSYDEYKKIRDEEFNGD